jgi:hypothetical protein
MRPLPAGSHATLLEARMRASTGRRMRLPANPMSDRPGFGEPGAHDHGANRTRSPKPGGVRWIAVIVKCWALSGS